MKRFKNEGGFTLVELVVVIVILGILAVIAVPKYMDLRVQAEEGVATGVTAALRGAIAIAHAKYLMDNDQTYDDDAIVAAIEQEGLTSLTAADDVITATFPSTNTYTWTYTPMDGDTPAKVAMD